MKYPTNYFNDKIGYVIKCNTYSDYWIHIISEIAIGSKYPIYTNVMKVPITKQNIKDKKISNWSFNCDYDINILATSWEEYINKLFPRCKVCRKI